MAVPRIGSPVLEYASRETRQRTWMRRWRARLLRLLVLASLAAAAWIAYPKVHAMFLHVARAHYKGKMSFLRARSRSNRV